MKVEQIEFKKSIKTTFDGLKIMLNNIKENAHSVDVTIDQRAMAVAITHLETAEMWAVRSLFSEEERSKN